MAGMKKISVESLSPGMVFTKPVYINPDNMLVGAGVPLSEDDIKKAMKWGVIEVETSGEVEEKKKTPAPSPSTSNQEAEVIKQYKGLIGLRKKLITVYTEACDAVEDCYDALRKETDFDTGALLKAIDGIIELIEENENIIIFLYGLEEERDAMVRHSVNVTFYSLIMANALDFPIVKKQELAMGTMLIDAGMMKLPVYIVHKQSRLTEQEFNQIKAHPLHGYKGMVDKGGMRETVALVSLQHHEQYDGKGYPRGLKGNEIHEYARIAAIADSYEAQITSRSYREKIYFYQAMRNLLSSGVSRFDPVILRVFLSRLSVYPIGSIVELNDNRIGVVVGSVPEKPLRPVVRIVRASDGTRIEKVTIESLLTNSNLYVTRVLTEEQADINIFDVL